MINSESKFSIYDPVRDVEYICSIRNTGRGEYYADDLDTDLVITSFDTEEIVELMFTGELERRSSFTSRVSLYIKVL